MSKRLPSMSHSSGKPKFHVTFYPPEGDASPQPPENGPIGEANGQPESEAKPELVDQQQVASSGQNAAAGLLHHQQQIGGGAHQAEESDGIPTPEVDASPSDATDWEGIAAFIAEATAADPARVALHQQVVKQDQVPNSRRNQPLTLSEEDRFLLCLSLGHSMRQAAAAIGCHHTTMVKRAKRDAQFAKAIALAKGQARTDPLQAVRAASQKSWRAAAWLLEYLERRDNRGNRKRSA